MERTGSYAAQIGLELSASISIVPGLQVYAAMPAFVVLGTHPGFMGTHPGFLGTHPGFLEAAQAVLPTGAAPARITIQKSSFILEPQTSSELWSVAYSLRC